MPLSLAQFTHRWKLYDGSEISGYQAHFLNLCELLGHPQPAEADSVGERYAFQKHVGKVYGGKGYADVWLRDHFAWEYKGSHADLKRAYRQLNDYREELGNPPLLVVSDFSHFEVHTNWTATTKRVYAFDLDDLLRGQPTATCPLPPLEVLRALFGDIDLLRPERTDAQVTQSAARQFARLAERLELEQRDLGTDPAEDPSEKKEQIAHFLMQLLFCLFADSIGLLPDRVFRNLTQGQDRFLPTKFLRKLRLLFEAMSEPDGIFGEHSIRYFNGGLFKPSDPIIKLDQADLGILYEVSRNYDWAHIAPAIFGTLFERSLDPKRRSLIGAHYTSEEDILLLIEPVLMRPLRQRWAAVREQVQAALATERAEEAARTSRQATLRADRESERLLAAWIDELTAVRVLDPACGSGNFLYVALRCMLDLWKEARDFAAESGISLVIPKMVSPSQLFGIETEFYAHELASVVVWIGFLQWKHAHGILEDREPILEKLSNIEHADAILRYDADGKPYEPEWPKADFIIGNPPFLGGSGMREEMRQLMSTPYVDDLRTLYLSRVPGGADLVTYWFEKARACIGTGNARKAGLIATQSIRNGANREVLKRIGEKCSIFLAWSDREWINAGASVRVSLIGFDDGEETDKNLDGAKVTFIYPNLTSGLDLTSGLSLRENRGLGFKGFEKNGDFEMAHLNGRKMLGAPVNPNGRPNADVVKPWSNGDDINGRPRKMYVIDFGPAMSVEDAALYELPFQWVKTYVYSERQNNNDLQRKEKWWLFGRSGRNLRNATRGFERMLVTPRVSKHRVFTWLDGRSVPDSRLFVFARQDNYFLGVLHSLIHEAWSLATSSRHGDGDEGGRPTYNAASCFDTFPFPWPPGTEPAEDADPRVRAIAEAARELVRLRDAWLDPPGTPEADLKDRTLTKLYNERPQWLANAHRTLDQAVFSAYGWPADLSKQEILARLLALNHERAAGERAAGERAAGERGAVERTAAQQTEAQITPTPPTRARKPATPRAIQSAP